MSAILKKIKASKPILGLMAGVLGACFAVLLFMLGWLEQWEQKTWDWRVQMMAKPSESTPKVKLIMLDQNSLDWAREENGLSWPWPREVYGEIISFCQRAQVRSLAFDVLFTEPSKYGVADDRAFAARIKSFNNFSGVMFLSRTAGSEVTWPSYATSPKWGIDGLELWMKQTRYRPFERASFPVKEISEAASALANVNMTPDGDSVYRRAALFEIFDGRVVPSLALASYLLTQPDMKISIQEGRLKLGEREIHIDASGRAIINFRGPSGTHKAYNAASVIQSELRLKSGEKPTIENLNDFKDAHVFFGFSAPGLFDLRPTPVSGVYPGVEINATMLDNLLSDDFIRPVSSALAIIITILLSVITGIATSRASGILKSAVIYLFFICVPPLLCLIAYSTELWLPLVVQETAVIITLFSSGLIYYTTEGRQKIFIKNAFKHYLSQEVIEQIIAHPERLKLGGERRILSIFFSDLEGFTAISENLEPEALTRLLNYYLSAMTDIILSEGGTVDKYEGDAIIAFWNAPLEYPDHATRCVRAALRCQAKLITMQADFQRQLGRTLNMRIGINTGTAVVGNMGSQSRFDYTMIGDAVNLAARLEGVNKQFGTYTLISQATREQLSEELSVREIARVGVVGRREPVVIYEPLLPDWTQGRRKEIVERFSAALKIFYSGDFSSAKTLFSEISAEDPPARAYLKKCEELLTNPPEKWDGVWAITVK